MAKMTLLDVVLPQQATEETYQNHMTDRQQHGRTDGQTSHQATLPKHAHNSSTNQHWLRLR